MKQYVFVAAVLFTVLILQSTVLTDIAVCGVYPDLLLVVTVSVGLLGGRTAGGTVGLLLGLAQDVLTETMFGMNALPKLLLGYMFGSVENTVFKEKIFLPMFSVCIATGINFLLSSAIVMLMGYGVDIAHSVVSMLLPLLAGNVILAVPVHWLLCWLTAIIREQDKTP